MLENIHVGYISSSCGLRFWSMIVLHPVNIAESLMSRAHVCLSLLEGSRSSSVFRLEVSHYSFVLQVLYLV